MLHALSKWGRYAIFCLAAAIGSNDDGPAPRVTIETKAMGRFVVGVPWALLLVAGNPATALVNPHFTPTDLVKQSSLVAVLKPSAPDANGRLTAQVGKCLKGKAPAEKVTIELMPDWVKPVAESIANLGDGPALLFLGKSGDQQETALFHLAGNWFRLKAKGGAAFAMVAVDDEMRGTWFGGSDMLAKAVEYILSSPAPVVPVAVGCSWADRKVLGKIAGPVSAAQAIDLAGKGQIALFVAADNGDRVYRYDSVKKDFADVTASLKLVSRSRVAAWADFTGDSRCDLANWDGKVLSLWAQSADGTFPERGVVMAGELEGECLGLSVLDGGVPGRAALLAGTRDGPMFLVPQKDGSLKPAALDARGADRKALGKPGACLVADFDGDGMADVLEPFAESSLFYKGTGNGGFAPAAKCEVAQGKGKAVAWLGDFDCEGRIDIFMSGEDDCRLWHNRGEMKFQETLAVSGEVAYMVQPGAVCGQTFDINNDGRPDVMVCYSEGIPWIFFNRGFRSFAKALEVTEDNVIPEARAGTQAAVVEDFNGDGAQDLAVVLTTGEVRMFVRSSDEPEKCLGVRVSLPVGRGPIGPVPVTAWADKRCLGVWNVTAGTPGPIVACGEPGEIVLKWHQWPGGKLEEKTVTLIDKPVALILGQQK